MKSKLLEVIKAAQAAGEDPARAVRDYLEEKDSRVSLQEAQRIVAKTLAFHKKK